MKTAIYVRSALNDNVISCETQIEHCKTKLQHDKEYVVYSDNGYSARNKEKPAFNEMMSAIERGEIDTVIVYRFNRVCRDLGSFTLFFENLRYHNVEFISASEGLDSSNPLGETVFKCLMFFAEMERASHSERCRRGWERRKQRMEGC
jgi:DNA invertase Pin-like site-specific DNA recombinase